MALSEATISFDLADQVGGDFDTRRTKIWVSTNIPDDTVVDTDSGTIRLGTGNVTIDELGHVEVTVWAPGPSSNPSSWQTIIHVDYPDRNAANGRNLKEFGPFTITTDALLADLIVQQDIPPTYLTQVTTLLDGFVDQADAAAASAGTSRGQAAASSAAAATAADLAQAAADAVVALSGGTQGLYADTDGTPFFDAAYTPPPGITPLAMLVDSDGVPYFAGA